MALFAKKAQHFDMQKCTFWSKTLLCLASFSTLLKRMLKLARQSKGFGQKSAFLHGCHAR